MKKVMSLEEIDNLRSSLISKYNIKEIRGVNKFHIDFLWDQIIRYNPKTVVEIGCCSGLSTGYLAKQMSDESQIHTIDFRDKWFENEDRDIGFLLKDRDFITEEQDSRIIRHFGKKISLDIEDLGVRDFEMVFIDGCHTHPWPTIDTIVLLPFMSEESVIVHHDLSLWRMPGQGAQSGTGPQHIHDSFDSEELEVIKEDVGKYPHIFAIHIKETHLEYEEKLAKAISKQPWTIPVFNEFLEKRLREFITRHYTSILLDAFNDAVNKHREFTQ